MLAPHGLEDVRATILGLPADAAACVIAKLPHGLAVNLLAGQEDAVVSEWLSQAALDDALTLVLHLRPERRERILATIPIRHMRRTLERLVVYPRRTVGAVVDPTVVRVSAATSLDEAVALLRAGDQGDLQWIWIVDTQGGYLGMLDLSKALLARSGNYTVSELAVALPPLLAETTLAAARDANEWLRHPELPVVDHQNHLLGALSRERLMAALAEDAPAEQGLTDGILSLVDDYFRVMAACLGDLFGPRGSR